MRCARRGTVLTPVGEGEWFSRASWASVGPGVLRAGVENSRAAGLKGVVLLGFLSAAGGIFPFYPVARTAPRARTGFPYKPLGAFSLGVRSGPGRGKVLSGGGVILLAAPKKETYER